MGITHHFTSQAPVSQAIHHPHQTTTMSSMTTVLLLVACFVAASMAHFIPPFVGPVLPPFGGIIPPFGAPFVGPVLPPFGIPFGGVPFGGPYWYIDEHLISEKEQ